ncbi:MAG: hypothetical protein ACE5NM_10745, partial [Sedimentisphaerales bacterium]
TMQLALEYDIEPKNMALAALAGIAVLLERAQEYDLPQDLCFGDWRRLDDAKIEKIIVWLWSGQTCKYAERIIRCVQNSQKYLTTFIDE